MKRAEDYLFSFTVVSSSLRPQEFIDAEIRKHARDAMREHLLTFHVKEVPGLFSRTHMAQAYVVPADEFWRLVQEEAMRLTTYSNRPRLEG